MQARFRTPLRSAVEPPLPASRRQKLLPLVPFFAVSLASARSHGCPQAKAIALAHQQAPLAAQGRGAGLELVPAVPLAAAAPPGLPRMRLLRWAPGGR